jgi:hypothetical protein
MKRFAILAIALTTAISSIGCCGLGGCYGRSSYYGSGNCPSGNCGVGGQPMVQPGPTGFYQGYDSNQQAAIGTPIYGGQVATAPVPFGTQPIHRTASLPLQTLPTLP